jgi:hypothetical protein
MLITKGAPPPPNAIDPMGMWLSTRQGPRPSVDLSHIPLDAPAPHDVSAFVAALTAGAEGGIDVDAAVHHCEMLAAAYRSAAEQREVAVIAVPP